MGNRRPTESRVAFYRLGTWRAGSGNNGSTNGITDSRGLEWLPTLFGRVLRGLRPRKLSCRFAACAGPEFPVCGMESQRRTFHVVDCGSARACWVPARNCLGDRLVLHLHLPAKIRPPRFVGTGNADGPVNKLPQ